MFGLSSLVSCGGSGGGNSEESEAGGFVHSTSTIEYTGLTSRAAVTKDNISKFLDAIFGGVQGKLAAKNNGSTLTKAYQNDFDFRNEITQIQNYLDIVENNKSTLSTRNYRIAPREIETENCEISGHVKTESFSENEFKLHFSECIDADGTWTNGTINVSFTFKLTEFGADIETAIFSYTDYFIDTGTKVVELSGRTNADYRGLGCREEYTSNLIARNIANDEQFWFHNLIYAELCSGQDESKFTLDGDIYLPDEGYLTISTIIDLWEEFPNPSPFPNRVGHFSLTGELSKVEIETFDRINSSENLEYISLNNNGLISSLTLISLSFDSDGDDIFEDVIFWPVNASIPLVTGGSLTDSDGDLMIDAWEIYYGLDSSNPNDASADQDGDGFTNLQESHGFSDPLIKSDVPLFNGTLTASLESSNQEGLRKGQDFIFTISTQTIAQNLPQRYWVDMYMSSNAELISPSHETCRPDPVGGGRKLCSIFYDFSGNEGNNERFHEYRVSSIDDSPITLDLKYSIDQFVNTAGMSNEIGITVDFAERISDLALGDTGFYSNQPFDNLEVGIIEFRALGVSNFGPDLARNVVIEIDFDPMIEIHLARARLGSTGQIFPCTHSSQHISCDLGEIPSFGGIGFYDLMIEAEALEDGIFAATATITSDSIDDIPVNNLFPHDIFAGNSSIIIQALIDSANDGDTISIPDGYYIGGFNANGKSLNFYPQNGKGSVHIWNNWFPGARIEKIRFGGLSQTSIFKDLLLYGAGNAIFVSGRVSLENNNFYSVRNRHTGDCISIGVQLDETIDSRIQQNYFECTKIDTQAVLSLGHQNLEITNNVFIKNNQEPNGPPGIIFLRGSADGSLNGKYMVKNNTLLGPSENGIYLSSNDQQFDVSEIYNNILVDIDKPVEFLDTDTFSLSKYDIQNNIFHSYTELDTRLTPSNLLADPILEPFTFTPNTGSIAIDNGLPEPGITIDFYGNPRPIDGDNNTSTLIDIGAVEVQ